MPSWHAIAFLVEVLHPDESIPDDELLFEKSVVLFRAADERDAREQAVAYCSSHRVDYPNKYGNRVEWRCRGILSVFEVFDDPAAGGTEVFSELLSGDEADALLAALGDRFEPV